MPLRGISGGVTLTLHRRLATARVGLTQALGLTETRRAALPKERYMSTPVSNDTPESKKAVFRRLVDIYATGNLSALDEVIASDYVGHASAGDRDLDGFRQSILYFHNLFIYDKDSFQVNDQFVEGEKVATRMTAYVKVRATGEPITLIGINLARIVGGKIVEEWNTWEQLQPPASAPQQK
ncbi:MAG: hypothetical protein EYC71_14635 [Gammaproteobacteria bacterium]|nr:MAG: hypothetical protein EYC71_14635 [Gammaproteobacteria bacterium]